MYTGEQLLDKLLKMPKEDLKKFIGFPDTKTPHIIHGVENVEVSKNVVISELPGDKQRGGTIYGDAIVLY